VSKIDNKRIRINAGVSTSSIAASFGGQALVLDAHGTSYPYNAITTIYGAAPALVGGKYFEVAGTETANENFLVVMEGADSGVTPRTVTRLTSTNLDAAQIGNEVVGFVPQTLTLPIT